MWLPYVNSSLPTENICVCDLLHFCSDILKQSRSAVKNVKKDIHERLMQSYKQVPQWWYLILLIGSIALSILMSFVWKDEVQLPWWGMLFAFVLAWVVTLPIGVIQATTNQVINIINKPILYFLNLSSSLFCIYIYIYKILISWILVSMLQQPGYDIIAQFIIGYILPGKPIANLLFKIYGRISTIHALSFLSDLKLGHYMKIPPRCMYTAQVPFD